MTVPPSLTSRVRCTSLNPASHNVTVCNPIGNSTREGVVFPVGVPSIFGGQQSARTIHFFAANFLVLFLLVHLCVESGKGLAVRVGPNRCHGKATETKTACWALGIHLGLKLDTASGQMQVHATGSIKSRSRWDDRNPLNSVNT